MSYPSLSVVVPLYNEEENVFPLVAAVDEALSQYPGKWELICVNDGSVDNTANRLAEARKEHGDHLQAINLQRNYGQTAAMQAGIDAARGELISTMDGDLQNDPADIPRMVEELIERDLDLLQGWRKDRKDALVSRKVPSRIANRLIHKVSGLELNDYGCSLKIYRAHVIKQVRLYGEMHRFIPIWTAMVTAPHRIGETVVHHRARMLGESKYGISRTFRVIIDLLAAFFFLRFRARPGHFFGMIGLMVGAIGGLLLAYLGVLKFGFGEDIGGRPLLLISSLLVVFSLQFLTTGVLAEMLSRVFFQATSARSYVVRQPIGDEQGSQPQDDGGWKQETPAGTQTSDAQASPTEAQQ